MNFRNQVAIVYDYKDFKEKKGVTANGALIHKLGTIFIN